MDVLHDPVVDVERRSVRHQQPPRRDPALRIEVLGCLFRGLQQDLRVGVGLLHDHLAVDALRIRRQPSQDTHRRWGCHRGSRQDTSHEEDVLLFADPVVQKHLNRHRWVRRQQEEPACRVAGHQPPEPPLCPVGQVHPHLDVIDDIPPVRARDLEQVLVCQPVDRGMPLRALAAEGDLLVPPPGVVLADRLALVERPPAPVSRVAHHARASSLRNWSNPLDHPVCLGSVDPAVGVIRMLCVVGALGELPSEEGAERHGCLLSERRVGGRCPFSSEETDPFLSPISRPGLATLPQR